MAKVEAVLSQFAMLQSKEEHPILSLKYTAKTLFRLVQSTERFGYALHRTAVMMRVLTIVRNLMKNNQFATKR
jgi:hypothetical protein